MLKKSITYTNYNGDTKTREFFFNLKKSELVDLQYSTPKGFVDYITKITESNDNQALWKAFRDIVLLAYGEKSDDGERFIKSKEISEAFSQTEAFSELIVELMSSSDAAANFVNAVMPKDLVDAAKEHTPNAESVK